MVPVVLLRVHRTNGKNNEVVVENNKNLEKVMRWIFSTSEIYQ
jgi:hypothetical protein